MRNFPLDGMRVLVIEDEFLIAMDVEQLCREHGATDVVIMRSLAELGSDPFAGRSFDVAILDVMVSRGSTLEFAAKLRARNIPFVFATGFDRTEEIFDALSDAEIVSKPYSGDALIQAMSRAVGRIREASGSV